MKRRHHGAAVKLAVIRAYKRLGSAPKAAAELGVSKHWAHKVVAAAGIVRRPTPSLPATLAREAAEIYATGLSIRLVVDELARRHPDQRPPSHEWVRSQLKRLGVVRTVSRGQQLRRAHELGRDLDAARAEAVALVTECRLSPREAGRRVGLSKTFVVNALPGEARLDPRGARLRRAWEAELPDVEARLDRRAEVLYRRRELGQTYDEICEATGLAKATVSFYLRQAGFTGRVTRKRVRALRQSAARTAS
jgi:hypothetical protein